MNKRKYILLLTSFLFLNSCKKEEVVYQIDGKLVAPSISVRKYEVKWDKNELADYYAIFVNDTFLDTTKDTNYKLEDRINGNYKVSVKAYDSLNRYSDSDYSNSVTYKVMLQELASPSVNIDGNVISWNDIEGASEYKVYQNNQYKNNWNITNINGVNYCTMYFDKDGSYDISVKAISNDICYEREKTANINNFDISFNKSWYYDKVLNDWDSYGTVAVSNNTLLFNPYMSNNSNGIKKNIYIDSNNSYLYLDFASDLNTNAKDNIKVYINNTLINTYKDSSNSLVYDLTNYYNKLVNIDIRVSKIRVNLLDIRLFGKDNVSNLTSWSIKDMYYEWVSVGDVQLHDEGFCLECINSQTPYIYNYVHIDSLTNLTISLRKFVRFGNSPQDDDPIVKLYANDTEIKPNGANYATSSGDAPVSYTYDLASFVNQDVCLKFVAVEGRHCVFTSMKLGK